MGGDREASVRVAQANSRTRLTTGSVDLTRADPFVLPSNVRLHLAHRPSTYERLFKPIIDRALAFVLIIALSPILLGAVLAIALTMGRPVLLRQHRVGRFGRVFTIYKLRTMVPDRRSERLPFAGNDRRTTHKSPDDPRITRVGRVLRKWSIDELPQLFNVLKGEMSLVGPRPELVDIVARYEDWQHQRHRVKPGLTCIWQISHRDDVPLHEATSMDLEYVETISLQTDFKLLALTPLVVLGVRNGS